MVADNAYDPPLIVPSTAASWRASALEPRPDANISMRLFMEKPACHNDIPISFADCADFINSFADVLQYFFAFSASPRLKMRSIPSPQLKVRYISRGSTPPCALMKEKLEGAAIYPHQGQLLSLRKDTGNIIIKPPL